MEGQGQILRFNFLICVTTIIDNKNELYSCYWYFVPSKSPISKVEIFQFCRLLQSTLFSVEISIILKGPSLHWGGPSSTQLWGANFVVTGCRVGKGAEPTCRTTVRLHQGSYRVGAKFFKDFQGLFYMNFKGFSRTQQAHKVCVGQNELVMSRLEDLGLNLTYIWLWNEGRSQILNKNIFTCVAMINQ
jgi:hypothetical protein